MSLPQRLALFSLALLALCGLVIATSAKTEQLKEFIRDDNNEDYTTDFGVKINDTDNTLKAGIRGPSLLEDFHFREKITRFDHERIPERAVHARGHGAHGIFESYGDFSDITAASFLSAKGKKTPVFVRFSTVLGSRGSADTVRDIRGFATKFYTDQGIFDLVGNDIPVFFIQDAIKFPDLVHAGKPEQDNEIPQAATAHDNFYDFVTLTPESLHTVLWTLSPRGIPRSLREIQGFGVHTFRFVTKDMKSVFVKFQWKPTNGVSSLVWDEAQKLAGKNPDFQRQDLYEAIESGAYPEYELGVQIVKEEDEHKFDFDLLDPTKIIPEDEVSVTWLGKMTLNKNPDNFFSETEQVAFCISHVVPGIDFTNDPLLQGRLFSYFDTQLNRFQSPNWEYLPINRPMNAVHNNQRDGFMQPLIYKGAAAHFPHSRYGSANPHKAQNMKDGVFVSYGERIDGHKIRARSPSFEDFYSQSQLFYNSLAPWERQQLIEATIFEVGKVKTKEIRQRWVDMINHVDHDYALIVAENIGVTKPEKKYENAGKKTKGISLDEFPLKSIKGKKIAILSASTDVDSKQIKSVIDVLEAESAIVDVIAPKQGPLHGTSIEAKHTFATADSTLYDAIFVPGRKSVDFLQHDFWDMQDSWSWVRDAYRHGKPIAALGEARDFVKQAIAPANLDGNGGAGVLMEENDTDYKKFAKDLRDAILKKRFFQRFTIAKAAR
ncbi:catalase 2 [Gaertneriomyces semiglobifer]|nr:catalase 2 [Gaertneriomyces semiglobifer]